MSAPIPDSTPHQADQPLGDRRCPYCNTDQPARTGPRPGQVLLAQHNDGRSPCIGSGVI